MPPFARYFNHERKVMKRRTIGLLCIAAAFAALAAFNVAAPATALAQCSSSYGESYGCSASAGGYQMMPQSYGYAAAPVYAAPPVVYRSAPGINFGAGINFGIGSYRPAAAPPAYYVAAPPRRYYVSPVPRRPAYVYRPPVRHYAARDLAVDESGECAGSSPASYGRRHDATH